MLRTYFVQRVTMSVIGRIVPSALQHSHPEEAILEPISGQGMDYAIQTLSRAGESSKHYPHKFFIIWSKCSYYLPKQANTKAAFIDCQHPSLQ